MEICGPKQKPGIDVCSSQKQLQVAEKQTEVGGNCQVYPGAFPVIVRISAAAAPAWRRTSSARLPRQYKKKLTEQANAFRSLNGKVETLCSFDTLQVRDYSKFNMAGFDEAHKKAHLEKQFPLDLEKAWQMGKRLVQLA